MSEAPTTDAGALRRKAERERRAREEAEAIAERATLELYQASERQKAVFMSVGDAILATDEAGRVTAANEAATRLLGLDANALQGRPLHDAVHPPTVQEVCPGATCRLTQAVQNGTPVNDQEMRFASREGKAVVGAFTFTPLVQTGRAVGSVLTLRDATLRKQAEETRIAMNAQMDEVKRLHELDQFKTSFINMAAHELRTPLTPIRTELYLLREVHPALPREAQRSFELLHRNFERLARLVEEVLEGARLQAGKLGVERRPMDLATVVHDILESFRSTFDARKIAVRLEGNGPTPVVGDAHRLGQVMGNLLSNAAKFTPSGGQVTVRIRQATDACTVAVADTGLGLTPDEAKRLFRPFSQVTGHHRTTQDGAGLGLYICRGIVELHGGRIWVESAGPQKGAVFTFEIPKGNADSLAPPTPMAVPTGGNAHA